MPLRVMIVDDNEASRVLLGCMVADLGHCTQAEARNMDQALDAYRLQRPDVVTLDLSMPDANGLTVLKALLALDPTAKVLIVSGNSQPRIIEALMQAGAGGYLTKPVTVEELGQAFSKLTSA